MKKIALLISMFIILFGCSTSKENIDFKKYDSFPHLLDFGHLSGIEPEVIFDEVTNSTTYVYNIEEELDQKIFKAFSDDIKDNKYKNISETRISDDGGVFDVLENSRYQLMLGDYSNEGVTYKLMVSIRPRYKVYEEFQEIPDFGGISGTQPTEHSSKDGLTVYIYEDLIESNFTEYVIALLAHDFEEVGDVVIYDDAYVNTYSNGEHNVMIGLHPTFLSVTIGTSE